MNGQSGAQTPPEAGAEGGRNFNEEQVEALLAEQESRLNREWQARLTPAQQRAANAERRLGRLEGVVEEIRRGGGAEPNRRGNSGRADTESSNTVPAEFKNAQTGEDIYHATAKMFDERVERRAREIAREERDQLEHRLNEYDEERLDRALQDVHKSYGGRLSEEHERQILETADRTENYDFHYIAYRLFGPPGGGGGMAGSSRADSAAGDDTRSTRERNKQVMLAGRARLQAATAEQNPTKVQVRRGRAGYDDVEKIALGVLARRNGGAG